MKAALQALDAAGGTLRFCEILDGVAARVALTPYDCEVTPISGEVRWKNLVRLFSINFVHAGFLRQHAGQRQLTPRGRAILGLPAEIICAKARQGYKDWKVRKARDGNLESDQASEWVDDAAGPQGPPSIDLTAAEGAARRGIERVVSDMSAYAFQELVAALLRAMGHTVAFVSPPGADGGTDILAYRDPLGIKTPHLRVQVKHRIEKAGRQEVAGLRGIIRQGREVGLFVSSGGFTAEAVREARQGAVHIELMDRDGVLEKWLAHYEPMREEDRRLLKLRPVYFLSST